MPTFYEGGAIEEVSQTLSENEYTQAFYIGQSVISPMHTKWVKTGICLSMAILIISLIPLYKSYFITVWIPFCALAVAVLLAFYFFFIQPKDIKKWAAQIYCTSAFLSIPQKIEIYRDSVIIKSEYEEILEYWTDFAKCVETNSFFVLTGGRERDLLIITKNGMNATQIERISKHFSNEFALRYMKKKR